MLSRGEIFLRGSLLGNLRLATEVREFMETALVVSSDESLFDVMDDIVKTGYVLVRNDRQQITGIVTASDINSFFKTLTKPFLLLSEIENQLRRFINSRGHFKPNELAGGIGQVPGNSRTIDGVDAMTLGEHVRLLQRDENWNRFNLVSTKRIFCGGSIPCGQFAMKLRTLVQTRFNQTTLASCGSSRLFTEITNDAPRGWAQLRGPDREEAMGKQPKGLSIEQLVRVGRECLEAAPTGIRFTELMNKINDRNTATPFSAIKNALNKLAQEKDVLRPSRGVSILKRYAEASSDPAHEEEAPKVVPPTSRNQFAQKEKCTKKNIIRRSPIGYAMRRRSLERLSWGVTC